MKLKRMLKGKRTNDTATPKDTKKSEKYQGVSKERLLEIKKIAEEKIPTEPNLKPWEFTAYLDYEEKYQRRSDKNRGKMPEPPKPKPAPKPAKAKKKCVEVQVKGYTRKCPKD